MGSVKIRRAVLLCILVDTVDADFGGPILPNALAIGYAHPGPPAARFKQRHEGDQCAFMGKSSRGRMRIAR